MMRTLGQVYLALALLGVLYCLPTLALYGYRSARLTVRQWRIARMR